MAAAALACLVGAGGGSAAAQPAAAPSAAALATPLTASQIGLLLDALGQADTHGLETDAFDPARLEALLKSPDAQDRQLGHAQLVAAVLRYARSVHSGRLAEADFDEDWGLHPAPYDPAPEFLHAVQTDQVKPWLESLPPPYTGYQTLRQGLATYRQIAAHGGWEPISAGPTLKPGASGKRVLELRARLAAEDPTLAPSSSDIFDEPLGQAVARAQKRFGLKDDGIVDADTLEALNTPIEERIDQILANMERWRWLPQELPTDRIQVNIAAAVLTLFHADSPTMSMRAVTGRPGDETPMLQSQIQSIVLNPPWNVPSTIAAKELWPKEKAHPGYLKAHDFVVVPTDGGGTRLQQKAGTSSALGRIKFDFPNPYAVYLHDTPTHATFDRYSRLASHGCVRLQKPRPLAEALLQADPDWTAERIDATIASGKTVRVPVPQPISVFLLYWTAYVGPDGQVNFRDDPYGWDKSLVQRLRAAAGSPA